MIRRLGDYDVINQLGEGGMGTVYLARDRRNGAQVAVKVLHPRFREDIDRRARFVREAQLGGLIEHPNVVAVHEVGEVHIPGAERTLFLALEFVPGRDLYHRMSFDPPSVREQIAIGHQVALGLAAAHQAGVLHRDVKPGNVMIRRDGTAKLLDFGLAALIPGRGDQESLPDVIAASSFEGTIGYASPEQILGAELDERSDLFSLGASLHHSLTGRLAYSAQSLTEAALALDRAEIASPDRIAPGVPPDLAELVAGLLRRDPDRRPQSAAEVAQRLEALLIDDDPTLARPPHDDEGGVAREKGGSLRRRLRDWVGRGSA